MKTDFLRLRVGIGFLSLIVMMASCEAYFLENRREGNLLIRLEEGQFKTKNSVVIPDSSDFLLDVFDENGGEIFSGAYGDVPERLIVSPGTYNVSIRTGDPAKVAFSNPVFGDDQCVVVPPGGVEEVRLLCSQVNSGVRLKIAPDFLTSYPKGVLFVKSDEGRLMYSYSEKRIAYFPAGEVSLMLDDDGEQSNLMTRSLNPKEILTVSVAAPAPDATQEGVGNIVVTIDTTRNWTGTDVVIGEGPSGHDKDEAMDVHAAKASIGKNSVWVYGYLAGSFRSSGNLAFQAPYPSATNCAISYKTTTTDVSACLSVELKKGELRDDVNLIDNPENVGRKIFLKGDIVESYYGIPGVKNITDYVLE